MSASHWPVGHRLVLWAYYVSAAAYVGMFVFAFAVTQNGVIPAKHLTTIREVFAVLLPVMGVTMATGSGVLADHWRQQRERQRLLLKRYRLTRWIPQADEEAQSVRPLCVFAGAVLFVGGVALMVTLIQGG
jgi:hypothetical protein